jgi:hypothetical protein
MSLDMTLASPTPVSIAEEILQLAKSAFSENHSTTSTGPGTDGLLHYNAKIQMQDLCTSLLQKVLGRQEYTVLLAGEYRSVIYLMGGC